MVLLVLAVLVGNIDYELAKRTGRAVLSFPVAGLLDGGSTEHLWLGYTLKYRHEIKREEDGKLTYLVGPELQGWNVFRVFGARRLFERSYAEELYYPKADRSERIVRGTIEGGAPAQMLFGAFLDIFPLAVVLALFSVWRKLRSKREKKPQT